MTITRAADNREYAETADFKLMTSAFYAPMASAFLRLQKATVLSFFRSTPSEYRTCRISYSVVQGGKIMEKNRQPTTICKSVFKGGESTTTEQEFTKMWARLINALEKNR